MENPKPSPPTLLALLLLLVLPIAMAMLVYRMDDFDAAALPEEGLSWTSLAVPQHYTRVLSVMEKVGDGLLPGPEDIVYDAEAGVMYVSCNDGWIYKVGVTDSAAEASVEKWVHVGGRPYGLALGPNKELIVAQPDKGLLSVTKDRLLQLLTDKADGVKFKLTDGVDVSQNGVIYFTDASYKYNKNAHMLDILEGRPHGRLISYDPSKNQTNVLVKDLYFANGVAISPQQDFIVFCETVMRRCSKYYIQGERKGSIESFVERLPGYPDNIHYDGKEHFWLALATRKTIFWDALMRYPWIRKTLAIMARYTKVPHMQQDAGVMTLSLNGDVIAFYSDPGLAMLTTGLKIDDYLYYGSLIDSYVGRIHLSKLASSTL